jgi:hypothetical protein
LQPPYNNTSQRQTAQKTSKIMRVSAAALSTRTKAIHRLQNATNAGYQRARQKFFANEPLWLVAVLGHARLWHAVRCCGTSPLLDVVLVCHCLRRVHANVRHAVARGDVRVLWHAGTSLLWRQGMARRLFRRVDLVIVDAVLVSGCRLGRIQTSLGWTRALGNLHRRQMVSVRPSLPE